MHRQIEGDSPQTVLPRGSIDSHIHVYGEQFPSHPNGTPPPEDQPDIDMYLKVQQWLGLERVVVVQANAHQTDNSCIINALSKLGEKARGVAVITPYASEQELLKLHKLGIRGARIMELSGGAIGLKNLLAVNARIAPLGWSNIIQFDGRQMLAQQALLKQVQGNFVIDHTGKYLKPVPIDHASFKALLNLIDRGNCYVKLAGCYETSLTGPPEYRDLATMSKALIEHAPERIIWGSNWPHVGLPPSQTPNDSELLDIVCSWILDKATLEKIFVENPARLYGFA